MCLMFQVSISQLISARGEMFISTDKKDGESYTKIKQS